MKRALAAVFLLFAEAAAVAAASAPAGRLTVWRLDGSGLSAAGGGADTAQAVGSLQKPFVAQAWAAAHPGQPTPRLRCDGRRCWLHRGHGTLGLARAVALSCNEYFLALAADTPERSLRAGLAGAGFTLRGPATPEVAIGLAGAASITPRRLLEAYVELTRTPWVQGDDVRREVLAGLREAARGGTARGLGHSGYWAKTGTAESPGGGGLRTMGWALAVDDAAHAVLARLDPGTGREAAEALGRALAADAQGLGAADPARAGPAAGRVRVHVFSAARPRTVRAVNRGSGPVSSTDGFVGPGAAVLLRPGDRLGESLWELGVPERRLVRRVQAALTAGRDRTGALEVVAEMDAREYASGVIAAELSPADRGHRVPLAAAVLRFLSRGPRHASADVCDSTHCAWFIGRGPRVRWPVPERAIADGPPAAPLEAGEWEEARAEALRPGPAQWTSHCGGRPLSSHAVWGDDDDTVAACPVHGPGDRRPWTRTWTDAEVARAFGGPVQRIAVTWPEGVFRLEVTTAAGTQGLLYDDAHARLARVLGWGGMPSPPDRVVRGGNGFRAEGVGLGHRVGLCLGPPR